MFSLETWVPGLEREWLWVIQVFIVVLSTALAHFFVKRFLARLLLKLTHTETNWNDIIVGAMSPPLGWVVWIVGLDIVVGIIYTVTTAPIFAIDDSIRNSGVLLCIAWFMLSLIRGAEAEFIENAYQIDRHIAEVVSKLLQLAVIIATLLVVLQTLGFSISGVLAMGGVGGIAVGFAARDLLANFFGGLIIYLDKPFSVGDRIRVSERAIDGIVEKIGWRITMIRNFESQPVYVPNSVFTSVIVENPSRMANRRIYEIIGLRYQDLASMHKIVDDVTEMLKAHEAIETKQTLNVSFNAFADSSVDFFIYAFTKTKQWAEFHAVKQAVMLQIAEIIKAHQAEIAFPTSTLYLANPIKLANETIVNE